MRADSFMTSPSWPVTVRSDRPSSPSSTGRALASTNKTSPPAPVTAKPLATPGTDVRSVMSASWKRARPSRSGTVSASTTTGSLGSDATLAATFRSTLARARSRERTPASRVWSRTMRRSASSVTVSSSARIPALASCRPSRWSRAMATFSSSV